MRAYFPVCRMIDRLCLFGNNYANKHITMQKQLTKKLIVIMPRTTH